MTAFCSDSINWMVSRANRLPMRWPGKLLLIAYLSLFISSAFAVHPYERWANELGIDMEVSYDGTRVMEMQDGSIEFLERRAPGKMYTETYIGNMTTGVILREDLGKSYILMPSMGFYREQSLDDGVMQAANGMEFSQIEKVGSESISGHPSTKYKTEFSDNEGKGAGFIWVTDSGVPIKMDMIYSGQGKKGQHIVTQFTELNLREQDSSHFELPSNLQPMTMGAGMGNLGQLLGMGAETSPAGSSASTGSATDTIESMTESVTEGTKGLISGIGGLFGMGDDEPEEQPRQVASASKNLSSDNLTQSVQLHLEALGYDPGNTDGEDSVQTSIAISQFQAEKGMKVTGEVTPQLMGVLAAEVDK